MAKDKLTDYDSTASGNLDVGGISVAEGMLPSGVNNAIREQMSHLADFASGTSGVDVLKLQDDTDTNSIKLQAPASVTATTTFTLPNGDGTADQVLKTDGSGQLGFADRHPNPSLIINGAMTVAQRGTSSTGLGASEGYYTVDRFQLGVGGTATAGRLTMSQDSDAPIGFGSCIKLACTTADTSIAADENLRLITVLEGQNLQAFKKGTANAESMTLSFYVKGNASATYVIELYDTDNARHICSTFSVTTSWQRVEITFDGDTTGAFGNDSGGSLRLHFWLHAGSNYNSGTLATSWAANTNANRAVGADSFYDSTSRTFQITGVKLEVGDTATPFVHRSYGEELALCQRYFYQSHPQSTGARVGTYVADSTGNAIGIMPTTVPMRATPTLTTTPSDWGLRVAGTSLTCSGLTILGLHTGANYLAINAQASGLTSTRTYSLRSGNTSARLQFDAEL